jgi:hypothetical protein
MSFINCLDKEFEEIEFKNQDFNEKFISVGLFCLNIQTSLYK